MTEQNKYSTTPRDYTHVGEMPQTIATGKYLGKVDSTSQLLARDIRNFAWAEDTQESIARFIEWCSILYSFTEERNDIIDFSVGQMNKVFSDALNEFSDLKPRAELSISRSVEALAKSQNALNVANGIDAKATNALSLSESADILSKSVQEQFNQVVIDGDSSVEAAQARVDASGQTNPTLKARLDKEHNKVIAQFRERTVSVSEFGAVGDGITDDYEAIQNTVNYVHETGGGKVLLPRGVNGRYIITQGIKWQSGVSLVGSGLTPEHGSGLEHRGSLFSAIYNTDGSSTGSDGDNDGVFLQDCHFSNFYINGENLTHETEHADGKGIFILYMRNCSFDKIGIFNTIGTGLGCDFLDKVSITNSIVENCGRNWSTGGVGQSGIGVGTNSIREESLFISGNVCRNNGNYGIFVETQENPNEDGTILSQGARITGNYCYGNRIGIGNKGSGATIISDNYIGFNTIGLQLTEHSFGDLVTGNRIEDNAQQGVYISGNYKGDLLLANNKIKRNHKGIEFIEGVTIHDILIEGNHISDNLYSAIDSENTLEGIHILSNVIKGNGKVNVAGYRQGIFLKKSIKNMAVLSNSFEPDETQLLAIQVMPGVTIENATISNNHAIGYSPSNVFNVSDDAELINVDFSNNSGVQESTQGTATMDGAFTYHMVEFIQPFYRAPSVVIANHAEGDNNAKIWVTDITRYGFTLRTDVKGNHVVRYGAIR